MLRNILVSLVAILCLTNGAFAAAANKKDLYGDINVRNTSVFDFAGKYVGLRTNLSFLSWTNTYKDADGIKLGDDDFSFKPLIGLSAFVGFKPAERWRADLEFAYVGKYSESETENYELYYTEKSYFDMVTYNVTVNGYYEFYRGLYAGVGTGIAVVKTTIEHTNYQEQSNTNISPMGALMLGYSTEIDDKVDFDVRSRVALFHGGEVKIADVTSDEGLVTDFSLSVGIRYNF